MTITQAFLALIGGARATPIESQSHEADISPPSTQRGYIQNASNGAYASGHWPRVVPPAGGSGAGHPRWRNHGSGGGDDDTRSNLG
jgi:hypothetical protein